MSGAPSGQGVYSSTPTYNYTEYLMTPAQMGVNSDASWKQFNNNVKNGAKYVNFILTSQNDATTNSAPMGMNYLLDTNTQCKATDLSGTLVERYTYIQTNNQGGMIDSMSSDIEIGLNPTNLELAFTPSIDCQGVTLATIDENNMSGFGTAWVATSEIANISPILFQNGVNPVTSETSDESFVNYIDTKYDNNLIYDNKKKKKKDAIESFYLTGIMVFGLYLIYCFMKKTK